MAFCVVVIIILTLYRPSTLRNVKKAIIHACYNENHVYGNVHEGIYQGDGHVSVSSWNAKGECVNPWNENHTDIIREWTDDAVIDWSVFPPYANALAMDDDRVWWWYTESDMRYTLTGCWWFKNKPAYVGFGQVLEEHYPVYAGEPEHSIIIRPGHEVD